MHPVILRSVPAEERLEEEKSFTTTLSETTRSPLIATEEADRMTN